jgi:subtilisin family serine protease
MIVAPGEKVFFAFPIQADSYMEYSGTSHATGYAAGVIALIIQKYPEMSVPEIEQRLKDRAVDLGTEGPDNDYGFGLISIPALLDLQQ